MGTERINNQFPTQIGSTRAEMWRQRTRAESKFDNTIPRSRFTTQSERSRALHGTGERTESDEERLRQRTIEELKTLVQAIQSGITDPWQLTDLIFYARHPEMRGISLTEENRALLDEWNQISALLVHPTLNEVSDILGLDLSKNEISSSREFATAFERAFGDSTGPLPGGHVDRFDDVIVHAVEWCPGLSPAILKSLLAQESNFNPKVINQWGYAGIAQFGREAAREVGLRVGLAGSPMDERLDPYKAIPAAAKLLNLKAQRLGQIAFSRYGQPNGTEFWKFVLAAYNGGEGTVALAMGHAYRRGLCLAREKGLVGADAVRFARQYASKWENVVAGGLSSPLGLAVARYFPQLIEMKYREISSYPTAIIARAIGAKG